MHNRMTGRSRSRRRGRPAFSKPPYQSIMAVGRRICSDRVRILSIERRSMNSISVRVSIVVGILSVLLVTAVSADNGPSFKFVSSEVGLSPRSVSGPPTVRLLLEGTQLPPGSNEVSELADDAGSSQVEFEPTAADPGKSTRHWLLTARFKTDERPAEGVRRRQVRAFLQASREQGAGARRCCWMPPPAY